MAAATTRSSATTTPPNTRDVFEGEAGDDLLIWRGGEDDDIMNGGDGADSIQVNGAGQSPRRSRSSRPRRPAASPSIVSRRPVPERSTSTSGRPSGSSCNANGGDDSLVSDAGLDALGFKLDIRGGDGNDNLDGGDGADLIAGDAGNDTITLDDNPAGTRDVALGGDGDDTMTWNGGDDDDVNDGGAGNDTVTVERRGAAGGVHPERVGDRRVTRPSTARRRPGPARSTSTSSRPRCST